jgi:MoaA/NifB/PqqE/SkfB family radical SAM enzyme
MPLPLPLRLLAEVSPRLLTRFVVGGGMGSIRSINRFERRRQHGEPYFPAFVFLSITNACTLHCKGCWVTQEPVCHMTLERFEQIMGESRAQGCRLFGILGGEPLLHPQWQALLARFPDCYFQLFTNGLLLDDAAARAFAALGNVTPIISIEGGPEAAAARRGTAAAHPGALRAVAACRRARLVTGVATSVCRSSFNDVVSVDFIQAMAAAGAHYLWYYIYRPTGENPTLEEALDEAQIIRLRSFLVNERGRHPIILVDTYWDDCGRALCPAATGISIHINPAGDIEPCPPVQFSDRRVEPGTPLAETVARSGFLKTFREEVTACTRGCLLLDRPELLAPLVRLGEAHDTSGRSGNLASIIGRPPCAGHHLPGHEIPERHWFYRLAKRKWFFGFGAYG